MKSKNIVKFRFPEADKLFSMHFDVAEVESGRSAYKAGGGQKPEISDLLMKTMLRRTEALRRKRTNNVDWDVTLSHCISRCANVNTASAVNE